MLENILIAALLMAIKTAIHAGFLILCMKPLLHRMFIHQRRYTFILKDRRLTV
jgi:hypothetical protein